MIDIALEAALDTLLEQIVPSFEAEDLSLQEGLGRILAEDVFAPLSNPPFDRSPLDGYAFSSEDSIGASKEAPVTLQVIGEVCAGNVFNQTVKRGETVRIMTGAPIPKGCDCVLRQEDTDYGEKIVSIYKEVGHYDNYCFLGEDIKEGNLLLKKGEKLSPVCIGVLASMGIERVEVKPKVSVALFCTGDELTEVGQPLLPGKIYNSNGAMLLARLKALGVEVVHYEKCTDQTQDIVEAIKKVAPKIDLIITTGGVSVGKKDIIHEVISCLGAKRLFWRVQMQPGTPVLASVYADKLMISLSGNPFAALTNFELLVRPVLGQITEDTSLKAKRTKAIMQSDFKKASKKRRFIRARYDLGKVYLEHDNHASGSLYTMSLCNCLIDIPAGTKALYAGDEVEIVVL